MLPYTSLSIQMTVLLFRRIPPQYCCLLTKSCLTLCDLMDCSLPGSSVHGISQARILEWVVISFSRGSAQPRDRTSFSCIGRQILYYWATWEAPVGHYDLCYATQTYPSWQDQGLISDLKILLLPSNVLRIYQFILKLSQYSQQFSTNISV